MSKGPGFTIYFEGDIASIRSNPFQVETAFGKPVIIGKGNVFDERDELEAALNAAQVKAA